MRDTRTRTHTYTCTRTHAHTFGSSMKKKVDPRVRALIESCVATNHRSLFVIVGDKGRHQVVYCDMAHFCF